MRDLYIMIWSQSCTKLSWSIISCSRSDNLSTRDDLASRYCCGILGVDCRLYYYRSLPSHSNITPVSF